MPAGSRSVLRARRRALGRRRARRLLGHRRLIGWRFCNVGIFSAFAVGQPHVVDRMLDCVQTGARREHPAGEDALDLALQGDFVHFHECVGVRGLRRWARIANARRDLQRAELHRLVDGDVERNDAAGDLVEAGNTAVGLLMRCGGGSTTISSPGCGRYWPVAAGLCRAAAGSQAAGRAASALARPVAVAQSPAVGPAAAFAGHRHAGRRWQRLRLDAASARTARRRQIHRRRQRLGRRSIATREFTLLLLLRRRRARHIGRRAAAAYR